MELKYTILENGFDFILSAINNLTIVTEDTIDEEAKKRLMKYALLHLSSGIELVFKYKLLKEHWTYVFADMNKANKNALQSGDLKSVDSETIIERLENLCDIKLKETERKDLKNLRMKRNKAEHFEFNEHIRSVESSIDKSLSILVKVILANYDIEEFSSEESELFSQIKDAMRSLKMHYEDAKAITQRELEQSGLSKYSAICPDCGEQFLIRDDSAKCIFCKYERDGEEAADDYIVNILGIDKYSTIKDGGEYPLYTCPECERESFVVDFDNGNAICFSCDFDCSTEEISFCSDCGMPYVSSNDEIGLCVNCADYRFNKDD